MVIMAFYSTSRLPLRPAMATLCRVMSTGEAGSGSGQGGGTGGAVRDAGGSLGKREAALEEQYFRKLQHRQLEKMRAGIEEEVEFHKAQLEAHREAIQRHHRILDDLEMNIRNVEARDKMTGNYSDSD